MKGQSSDIRFNIYSGGYGDYFVTVYADIKSLRAWFKYNTGGTRYRRWQDNRYKDLSRYEGRRYE